MGFFPESLLMEESRPTLEANLMPKCGACGLFRTCDSPKIPLYGQGERGILILGDAPGNSEDRRGYPFAGKAGTYLRDKLSELGVDLERDCWSTNAIICRPPKNATPTDNQVTWCQPNLLKVLREKKPKVVIILGPIAVKSLIGWAWKERPGGIAEWAGWRIPCQDLNAWLCPTFHPAHVLRQLEDGDDLTERYFTAHLSEALQKRKHPYKEVPDLAKNVKVVMDDRLAYKIIRRIIRINKPTAVDYETNALKPEYEGAKILCVSLSIAGSKKAYAFPWFGKVIKGMKRFWRSKVPKIASNLKFESRWTRRFFKFFPKNWHWDTMLAAHALDCRPGITSIKFQVFVRCGVGSYNDHIEPFLRAAEGHKINLAEMEIDMRQLCQYCGEDSLYEGEVYLVQKLEMNALAA